MRGPNPWPAKLATKIIVGQLPISYATWQRFGLFRHGSMDDLDYAIGVFRRHWQHLRSETTDGFTALEIGPGDSLLSAVLARAAGAERVVLVDVGRFATDDLTPYRDLSRRLREANPSAPDLEDARTLSDVLERCNATYRTDGIAGLADLATGSISFSWSQAVLEHVHRSDLPSLLGELHRVHEPGSTSSHRVDLQDHLAAALNNLRFPDRIWERKAIYDSGAYTNRLRCSEVLDAFAAAGFEVGATEVDRWPEPPISRRRLAPEFRHLSDDDLRISGFDVVLTA